jgi:hypothetical protein
VTKRRRSTAPSERKLFAGGQFPIDTPVFHPDQRRIEQGCPAFPIPGHHIRALQHADGSPALFCKECGKLA